MDGEDAVMAQEEQQERFEGQEIDIGEKINVLNRFLSFFKDLAGQSEEYQDELLRSCIDLLL